ncbi:MAG: OmpA family protein [Ignavibacteria bacterium]|nr:OmpA family protein [Ignavibacteria bacterium]
MRIYYFLIITCLISIVYTQSIQCEDTLPEYSLGIYGGVNLNLHSAGFSKLPDVPNCCPEFKSGFGLGYSLGLQYEKPFSRDLSLNIRLGITALGAELTKNEDIGNTPVLINKSGTLIQEITPVMVAHTINSYLYAATLKAALDYYLFPRFKARAGLNIAVQASSKFSQQEEILSPDNVTFLDGRIIRNELNEWDVPEQNLLLFYGLLGVSYDLPVGTKSVLSPEFDFNYCFSNISSVNWKPHYLYFGLAFKYQVYPKKPPVIINDTIYKRDTSTVFVLGHKQESIRLASTNTEFSKVESNNTIYYKTIFIENYLREIPKIPILTVKIDAVGITKDGSVMEDPKIVIEETEVEEKFSLLPQIFFKEGNSELDSTDQNLLKVESTKLFDEQKLTRNTLSIYKDMLNIIAARLMDNPSAKIVLIGCTSNSGIEMDNITLSKKRAESVKKYLESIWKINSQRISLRFQNLPERPSNNQIEEGKQENRRVEIVSNDPKITAPLSLVEIERTANPPVIRITPEVESEVALKGSEIIVEQQNTILRKYEYPSQPTDSINWNIEEKPMPQLETPVLIKLKATDETEQIATAEKELTISQLTIRKKRYEMMEDKRIERFSLILFDFDKAEITPTQMHTLQEIRSSIKPNSTVSISGYTDRIGEGEYNLELARRRCFETQKALKVDATKLTLNPIGSQALLYDNSTPQGRSYCRTVVIEIITPVTK